METQHVSETALIREIIAGNRDAFQTLIEQYKRLVYHIVFRMVSNETEREDVCQDIFVKVFQNLSKFQSESKLSTWIARIAYNTSINHLKKKKVDLFHDVQPEETSLQEWCDTSSQPDVCTEKRDLSEKLNSEIQQLPVQLRTILVLYHQEQMSYAEMAEILQLPDGTVKSYLFRARKLLKERLLAKYQPEELWEGI